MDYKNNITFEALNFFSLAPNANPKDQVAFLWLSPKMFTEDFTTNQLFIEKHGKHDNSMLSFGELYRKYAIIGSSKVYEPLQFQKQENDQARYRPYIIFYHKPTNCTWAMPMSTSYSFEKNPNNKSFYQIEDEIYKYVYTNINKPDRAIVEPTMAFPIAANMAIFKQIHFNKYNQSEQLDKYIKLKFTENDFFSKLASSSSYICYTTREENLYMTSAGLGMFLLNFLYQKSNIAIELSQKHTTSSSLLLLENCKAALTNLKQNAAELEKFLIAYLQAKTEYEADQKSVEKSTVLSYFTKRIAEVIPHIQKNIADMGIDNISNFAFNLEFANEFVICSQERKRSSFEKAIENISNGPSVLDDAINKILEREQKRAAQASIHKLTKDLKVQNAAELEKRKKQSEKDKQNYIQARFEQAKESISDLLRFGRLDKNGNIDIFIENIDTIDSIKEQIKRNYEFLTCEHDDLFVQKIVDSINKIEPDILEYGEQIVEKLNSITLNLGAINVDELYNIRQISKKRKIEIGDFTVEQINMLCEDKSQTQSIISETNKEIGFINEFMECVDFLDDAIQINLESLSQKVEELQDLQAKKYEKLISVFGNSAKKVEEIYFNLDQELENIDTFSSKKEIIDFISKIGRNIDKLILQEKSNLTKLEKLVLKKEEIASLEEQISQIKNMTEEELCDYIIGFAAEIFENPQDIQIYHMADAEYKTKFAFERKIIRTLIDMLPESDNFIQNLSWFDDAISNITHLLNEKEMALTNILCCPMCFATVEKNMLSLSRGLVDKSNYLNLANGNLYSKYLSMIIDSCKNRRQIITEIEFELKNIIYDKVEGKTAKQTALTRPKFKYAATKIIAKNLPTFINKPVHVGEQISPVYDDILRLYTPCILSNLVENAEENIDAKKFINGDYTTKSKCEDYSKILGFFDNYDIFEDLCGSFSVLYNEQKTTKYFVALSENIRANKNFQAKVLEIIKKHTIGTPFEEIFNKTESYLTLMNAGKKSQIFTKNLVNRGENIFELYISSALKEAKEKSQKS